MSNENPLGKLASERSVRDAVHVAIYPVKAGEFLRPATQVRIEDNLAYACYTKSIGIVDPFLLKPVKRGEWFYLCVYPNTITGMVHHWTHPDISPPSITIQVASSELTEAQLEAANELRAYAEHMDVTYEEFINDLTEYQKDPSHLVSRGSNTSYESLPWEKVWIAYSVLTGSVSPGEHWHPYYCSC